MPATVIGYATQERDAYSAAQSNAQAVLATTQLSLAAAKKTLDTHVSSLQQLEAQIAAKRAQLAVTTLPSDAAALLVELTALLILDREQQSKVLDDRAAVSAAQAVLDTATAQLTRATARLAQAQAALITTTQEDTQRQSWKLALTRAPLATLPADASTVLAGGAGTLYAKAQAKFSVLPPKLLELATQRYELWSKRLNLVRSEVLAAEDKAGALESTDGGLEGQAHKAGIAFRRDADRLSDFVLHGKERYDRALALLQRIADPGNVVLTPAEQADVNNAALEAGREASEGHEKDVNTAQEAVDTAQEALDEAVLAARAKDPNVVDVSGDAGVIAAKGALTTAQGTLTAKLGAFTGPDKTQLNGWAAIVPDSAWRQLLDFLVATSLLTELKNTPATLASDLDAAEDTYATALIAAGKSARSLAFLQDSIDLRRELRDAAQADQPNRLLSAIRGDAN